MVGPITLFFVRRQGTFMHLGSAAAAPPPVPLYAPAASSPQSVRYIRERRRNRQSHTGQPRSARSAHQEDQLTRIGSGAAFFNCFM